MATRSGILLWAIAACLMTPSTAPAGDNVAIQGKVLFRGKPVPGAVISVLGRTVKAGADGGFRLEGVPALHGIAYRHFETAKDGVLEYRDMTAAVPFLVVAAFAEMEEGGILGFFARKVERAAFRQVSSGDAGRPLALELEEIADREGACRRCHPDSPALDRTVVLRPAKEGTPAPAITADGYTFHRHRDSHPSGFVYREVVSAASGKQVKFTEKVEGVPLGEGKRVDCLTCHTAHVPTEAGAFARDPFRESNRLCQRCHR